MQTQTDAQKNKTRRHGKRERCFIVSTLDYHHIRLREKRTFYEEKNIIKRILYFNHQYSHIKKKKKYL